MKTSCLSLALSILSQVRGITPPDHFADTAATPEPATIFMIGAGLVAIGLIALKRWPSRR